jgi:hypothetical protein
MPRDPTHEAIGATDPLTAAHALNMIVMTQLVELPATVACGTEGHHQLLFVKGGFEGVRTHLDHRNLYQIFFLKGWVGINVNFDKSVWILRL